MLLGDIFRKLGVTVFYSGAQQDLDDCLASYASLDGAALLSDDGDYFRYSDRDYVQYGKFRITAEGRLEVNRRRENPNKAVSRRSILRPKPKMLDGDPSLVSLESEHLYRRGAPSALVKVCGNPHGKVLPLRCALYAALGVTGDVREEWPEWDANKQTVVWHSDKAVPNPANIVLFAKRPQELFVEYFGSERRPALADLEDWEWDNHLLACRTIVCELWLVGQMERRGDQTLLSVLLQFDEDGVSDLVNTMTTTSLSGTQVELAPDCVITTAPVGDARLTTSVFERLATRSASTFKRACAGEGIGVSFIMDEHLDSIQENPTVLLHTGTRCNFCPWFQADE